MSEELKCGDISDEKSRQYEIYGCGYGLIHVIHIDSPKKVFYGLGHTFHRVFDGESTVLAPAPGFMWHGDKIIGFCEVSWVPGDPEDACQW